MLVLKWTFCEFHSLLNLDCLDDLFDLNFHTCLCDAYLELFISAGARLSDGEYHQLAESLAVPSSESQRPTTRATLPSPLLPDAARPDVHYARLLAPTPTPTNPINPINPINPTNPTNHAPAAVGSTTLARSVSPSPYPSLTFGSLRQTGVTYSIFHGQRPPTVQSSSSSSMSLSTSDNNTSNIHQNDEDDHSFTSSAPAPPSFRPDLYRSGLAGGDRVSADPYRPARSYAEEWDGTPSALPANPMAASHVRGSNQLTSQSLARSGSQPLLSSSKSTTASSSDAETERLCRHLLERIEYEPRRALHAFKVDNSKHYCHPNHQNDF